MNRQRKVATALTVYGIETCRFHVSETVSIRTLQQPLPFTVLKLLSFCALPGVSAMVATALTVYGIETIEHCQTCFGTISCNSPYRLRY